MTLNLIVVGLYGINLGVRSSTLNALRTPADPLILSLVGIALLSVSGYLGGRLVYDEGISVGRHKRRTPTPENTLHLTRGENGEEVIVPVPEAERLGDRETLRVEIDGQVVAIVKLDGDFYAFQEFCTHDFKGFDVQCPWHNSCFDMRTGKVTNGPAKVDLKTFRVEARDGKLCVGVQHTEPRNPRDQETEVRRLQIILAEEEPENGKAKKFGHV